VVLGLLAAAVAPAGEIRVTGSDLLGEQFARAVENFSRENDLDVRLDLHGTRPGLADLEEGNADLGLFLRPDGEPAPGDPLTSRVIGYQVAIVVVPAASPLRQLTLAQARGLFASSVGGAFTRWGELNLIGDWTSRPVVLHALAPTAGLAWPLFQHVVLADEEPRSTLEWLPTAEMLARRLRANENSIGVAGLAANAGLRVLALAASATDPAYGPTPENVQRGSYPLRLPLSVTFRRESAPELQLFLKFLLSEAGAAALAPAGFVPLPVGRRHQLVFELEEMR